MQNINLKSALDERGIKLTQLATALRVDKGTVTRWHQGRVPAERVLDVEGITGIPREKLRPDLYAPKARASA
jgi:DNA-binding transcriptional regulator YdaS (Cro superfamily)